MKRQDAIARDIEALTSAIRRAFAYKRRVHVPAVVVGAVADARTALDDGEHARAERLVEVAKFLIEREGARFRADPVTWLERQRVLAELAA
jgi:hypothetical protein